MMHFYKIMIGFMVKIETTNFALPQAKSRVDQNDVDKTGCRLLTFDKVVSTH